MNHNSFEDWLFTKYYIFGALFQLIWSLAVLGFTLFMVWFFHNPYYLFFTALILVRPYRLLARVDKSCTDDKHKPSDYGSNNPPHNYQ